MGGQACVLYGAAEFSRDTDLAILATEENLDRLRNALEELQAECIAVPPFEPVYLEMGLAVHFRCHHPDADKMRIDVMTKMRGVEEFSQLWDRRTTIDLGGETIDVLSLPDLVQCKKTQRDKDWPMIVRLVEANYFTYRDEPSDEQIDFWLRELRTPTLLAETAAAYPARCRELIAERGLLALAESGDHDALQSALDREEQQERERDRQYWQPLRAELQRLRKLKRSS